MSDRELLELAAKAAGYTLVWDETYEVGGDTVDCTNIPYVKVNQHDEANWYWNPLEDDGDALRLAVKIGWIPNRVEFAGLAMSQDPYVTTRRAIVRAAAEIGRQQ